MFLPVAIVGRDVRATGSPCLAPSSASPLASARSSAPRSSSNGPRTRLTATSRRTSRSGRRRRSGGRRASSRRSTPSRSRASTRSRRPRWPGRASSTCAWPTRSSSRRWRRSARATAAAGPTRRERVQVEMVSANPTGPIVVSAARNGAYGDCVARLLEFGGHDVSREYYYNDAGAQMDRFRESIAALRRGEPVPEDGYQGAYVEELAAADGDPVPKMLASIEHTMERFRIHFDSWALQSELEQRLRRAAAEARHLREGRRALGALVGLRRRAGLGADPLATRGAALRPTAPPTSRISSTSSTAASTARSTCSAPTITRQRAGTRRSHACSGSIPSASRCCSTSSCT